MSVWTDPLRGLRFSIIIVSLAFLVGGIIHRQDKFRSAQIIPAADSAQIAKFQERAEQASQSSWNTINVNTADAHQLEALPGIGPVKAKRIVEYREQHGPFRQPKDLLGVKGIGPKTMQRMTPLISLDTPDSSYQTLNKE